MIIPGIMEEQFHIALVVYNIDKALKCWIKAGVCP